jgi:GT2 family glycosyltransferase
LKELITEIKSDQRTAFAGSVILDADQKTVQCCGVKYYKYFGVSKLILKGADWATLDKNTIPLQEIDFQHGASLMVRMDKLREIGLMDEQYFLYFEEHDWEWEAMKVGYNNKLAPKSIIYHKGSVSTNNRKHLFFYYYNRSSMIFSRKHNNAWARFCSAILLTGVTIVRSRLYFKSLFWGLKGLAEGLTLKLSNAE